MKLKNKVQSLKQTELAFILLETVHWVDAVIRKGQSLKTLLAQSNLPDSVRGGVQDLSYCVLRYWMQGCFLKSCLIKQTVLKPLLLDDLLTVCLILAHAPDRVRYEPYTLVDQAVKAAASNLDTIAGKGLINACLRRYYREQKKLLKSLEMQLEFILNFPRWWQKHLQTQYPNQWMNFLKIANTQPPLTLRINRRKQTLEGFLQACSEQGVLAYTCGDFAVYLPSAAPVWQLPGFIDGWFSVQDLAAQQAAPLLDVKNGMKVLDACCAPGGKTSHLLEIADLDLLALDVSQNRLQRVHENLERLGLMSDKVNLCVADVSDVKAWWDGEYFDAILADLPCSASGILRRHPDIRWLRKLEDIAQLSQLQLKILQALWSVLKPAGTLLVVTCSIFEEEGSGLMKQFLEMHQDAMPLSAPGLMEPLASNTYHPGNDGFFYAKLKKNNFIL